MKETRLLLYLLCAMLGLASCGGSDDDSEGGVTPPSENVNRNIVTGGVPTAVTRPEFPRVKGGRSRILVYRTGDRYGINYCVEWDADKKSQRWSCYQMYQGWQGNAGRYDPKTNPGNHPNERQYPYDPNLPASERWEEDYFYGSYFNGARFDHGHICPSADRQYSKEANYQTFYMTNMQPQYNRFNAKLWAEMENKVRKWTPSSKEDTLFVCKGGTIDSEENILTRIQGRLIVPKYFYMAVLLKVKGKYTRAIAFWAENENRDRSNESLKQFAISIDELERRTGIDFFCNVPDDDENSVESSCNTSAWGLR